MLYYSEGESDQAEQTDLQAQPIQRSITVCRKSSRYGQRAAWQKGEYLFDLKNTYTHSPPHNPTPTPQSPHPHPNTLSWISLDECQVPTKVVLSLLPSTGQGRKNMMKGLWIGIRTGRDHSQVTIMGKTD